MESSVLDSRVSPDVVKRLNEEFVPVELFTDLPAKYPEEAAHRDLLTGFSGGNPSPIPVYLIVSPDGKTVLARRNGRIAKEEFVEFMEEGLSAGR